MPRPRTGTVWLHGDHYDARITLPDGSRSKPICLHGFTDEEAAKAKAKTLTDLASREGGSALVRAKADLDETFATWLDRWSDDREAVGYKSMESERSRINKWVKPHLGKRPVRSITRDEIESFVEVLDEAAREHARALEEHRPIPRDIALSWKSANTVWCNITKAFSDACSSKRKHLRVRQDNPASNVKGPDAGRKRRGPMLYPTELQAALTCAGESVDFRRGLALATYSMLRTGELKALRWEDVNLDALVFDVHRAVDRHGEETSVKSEGSNRYVKIEPVLVPLLEAMKAEAGGTGVVAAITDHLPRTFRRLLEKSGCKREALFANEASRRPIRWHDLRATGLTYRAIRGDNPLEIRDQAGHEDFATTMLYVRLAAAQGITKNDVFQPIPACLVKRRSSDDTADETRETDSSRDDEESNEACFPGFPEIQAGQIESHPQSQSLSCSVRVTR